MKITLFDDSNREELFPLTLNRSCADIRWGILTIKEKWELILDSQIDIKTESYIQPLYGNPINTIFVNSRLLPDPNLIAVISNLKIGDALYKDGFLLAKNGETELNKIDFNDDIRILNQVWEIFQYNHREINLDFEMLTKGRISHKLSVTNKVIGSNPIFLDEGVKAEFAIFNTTEGPIYLGKESEVMEGAMIRGPFSLGEYSQVKMGARIYSGSSFGPHCKVGGEVSNSVIFGYSNKGHEGFLGNSVLGEWCNLGADTNNSNLKNNYEEVRLWNYKKQSFVRTGLQFCGLIMGDHSKSGINTMFNTGTVVGFSSNIFGSGFPRNYIPSFSWGGAQGMDVYALPKALQTAQRVMERRGIQLNKVQKEVFAYLFEKRES
ncbi:MAG: GlmU family protein [Bacteroidetes bacterium]|nr:GlmU family protein [Bacteroidota bacterium]